MNIKFLFTALIMFVTAVSSTAYASKSTDRKFDEFKAIEAKYNNVIDDILDVAQELNVDPVLPASVAYRETRFDHTLKNQSGSSAKGLFQITNDTAGGLINIFGEKMGIKPGASMYDKKTNIKLGIAYMTLIETQMSKSLGRNVTNGEIYLGLKYGPAGAASMLKNPNQLMVAWSPKAMKGNEADFHDSRGRALTKGQAARQVINQYNEAARFYGPIVAIKVSERTEIRLAAHRAKVKEERRVALEQAWKAIHGEPEIRFLTTTVNPLPDYRHVSAQAVSEPIVLADLNLKTYSGRKYKGDII